ncbi:hypothetical protein [Mycobacterium kiyosense]
MRSGHHRPAWPARAAEAVMAELRCSRRPEARSRRRRGRPEGHEQHGGACGEQRPDEAAQQARAEHDAGRVAALFGRWGDRRRGAAGAAGATAAGAGATAAGSAADAWSSEVM